MSKTEQPLRSDQREPRLSSAVAAEQTLGVEASGWKSQLVRLARNKKFCGMVFNLGQSAASKAETRLRLIRRTRPITRGWKIK